MSGGFGFRGLLQNILSWHRDGMIQRYLYCGCVTQIMHISTNQPRQLCPDTLKSLSAIYSCNHPKWVCFWGYPDSEDVQCEWFHDGIPGFRVSAASVTIGERCLSQWDGFIWRLSLFALPLRRNSSGFIAVLGTEWWNCWKAIAFSMRKYDNI